RAERVESPALICPKGVRAVRRITELGIYCLSFPKFTGLAPVRQVQRVTIPTGQRKLAADEGRGEAGRAGRERRGPGGRGALRGRRAAGARPHGRRRRRGTSRL